MTNYAVDNWMTSPTSGGGLIYHPRRAPSSGERVKRQRSRSRSGALQCLAVHQADDDDDDGDDWYRAAPPEVHWSPPPPLPPPNHSVMTSSPFRVTSSPLVTSSSLFRSANYSFHNGQFLKQNFFIIIYNSLKFIEINSLQI